MRRQGDGEPRRPGRDMVIGLLLAVGLVLAVGGAMTAALAGLGHRWDWWHFSTGFAVLRYGIYAGIGGVAVSALAGLGAALLKRPWLVLAALPAIAIGAAVIAVPHDIRQRAAGLHSRGAKARMARGLRSRQGGRGGHPQAHLRHAGHRQDPGHRLPHAVSGHRLSRHL
jgi:hypothetical protein